MCYQGTLHGGTRFVPDADRRFVLTELPGTPGETAYDIVLPMHTNPATAIVLTGPTTATITFAYPHGISPTTLAAWASWGTPLRLLSTTAVDTVAIVAVDALSADVTWTTALAPVPLPSAAAPAGETLLWAPLIPGPIELAALVTKVMALSYLLQGRPLTISP